LNVLEEKKQLIEEVGIRLEDHANLSPLAARVYATLILSSNNGLSFNEIISSTKASKSSISTSLNILLQLSFIEYYTKSGDRKRYFRTNQFYSINTIKRQQHVVQKELDIVQKINAFNTINNPEKFKNEKSIGLLFQEYLEEQQLKINKKLKEIYEFQKQA